MSLGFVIHYFLHFGTPFILYKAMKEQKKKAFLSFLLANLIDLDHLLATPIYSPGRLSLGFHPLHSFPIVGIYFVMLFHSKTRLIGLGLLFHLLVDGIDFYLL